jgi:hypothetical protein
LVITVLGPTVLRVTARVVLDQKPAASRLDVVRGEEALGAIELTPTPDPDVATIASPRTAVGMPRQEQIAVIAHGPQRLVLAPDQGVVWLRLAVAAARPVPAAREPAATGSPSRPVVESDPPSVSPVVPSLDERLLAALAPSDAPLPWTTVVTTGIATLDRPPGVAHTRAEPFIPLRLELHRRLGQRTWVWGGPELRLRSRAPATSGLGARLTMGGTPGPHLDLASAVRLQPIGDELAWSSRSRIDAGWEMAIGTWTRVRATLGWALRLQSLDGLPDGARQLDPLVFSLFGRDHPHGPRLRAAVIARPLVDLVAVLRTELTGNADLRTVDRYAFAGSVWAVLAPAYAQLSYEHARALADSDRFLPYSTDRLGARVGVGVWLSPGHRLRVEVADRLTVPDVYNEARVSVVYEISLGRGTRDLAPAALPLASLWAEEEPTDLETLP